MVRRHRIAMGLLLASAAVGLSLGIGSLASGSAKSAFDWAVVAFWLVVATATARVLLRR